MTRGEPLIAMIRKTAISGLTTDGHFEGDGDVTNPADLGN